MFESEHKRATYHNFDLESICQFKEILSKNPDLHGLNVTIPYKESIIEHLDKLDCEAEKIGAVNTIKFNRSGYLVGYNTDHYGFAKSLSDFLPLKDKTALVLGTGGASKAIRFVLDTMNFKHKVVSRNPKDDQISYEDVSQQCIENHFLIINCTPLGTSPNTSSYPPIPYQYITKDHVLFDLVYNPEKTEFLKFGQAKGARITNGYKMLECQAKKSWDIWKS